MDSIICILGEVNIEDQQSPDWLVTREGTFPGGGSTPRPFAHDVIGVVARSTEPSYHFIACFQPILVINKRL